MPICNCGYNAREYATCEKCGTQICDNCAGIFVWECIQMLTEIECCRDCFDEEQQRKRQKSIAIEYDKLEKKFKKMADEHDALNSIKTKKQIVNQLHKL